jgi:hypothetical protein
MKTFYPTLAFVTLLAGAAPAAQHPDMPAGMSHEEHLRQIQKDEKLKQRGALAMGFDQDKTVHHFLLQLAGGAIVVTSKDAGDAGSIAQIRSHLREIAQSFGNGLFDKPVATHGEMPPGSETMAAHTVRITYRYEERAGGAAVVMETSAPDALTAIHDFLRYQIVEHKTGDPLIAQQ